ncbi:Protein NRT1/ PTR FAMILY 5.6 isoform B [Glycine soja]|uniref:Protein NRT1/ PTR FAMILY 5.6 isoform A n=1 Tax=Glycine soja TaxID=3848 RepID=A0A445FNL6_GLYSO|nr:Putative peptide/nitrate transporter [Glycine soja]RZB50459.1 Protein NRT1/ PTR FAMILY 5.6 isoform A [Glycine soja]RZB50460.1 Protein NRT1/ PTR FAMILY 5.6 isoform B [Glycine soja]
MKQEMEKRKGGRIEESDEEKWVHDASVDYKGRIPLRASTGVWKASLFVLAIEFSERIAHFGISSNLIMYLTEVMHEDLKTATNNANLWKGATTLLPMIGGFLGDAYTGRFRMVVFSSLVYFKGLSLLTMSQFIPNLKPCNNDICHQPRKVHEVVFFLALYCIALGTGGFKPCLESFGGDQFDGDNLEERKKKMSFFNWWTFTFSIALLLATTVVVYVQDFVSWGVAYLILAMFMALTIIAFYVGIPFYRYRMRPNANPFIPILQVLIASIRKRNLSCPSNPALLCEVPMSENSQGRLLNHTSRLRFLDKAAIVEEKYIEKKAGPWRLATVTRVEETKLILNVVPIWLTSLMIGVCIAQGSTLFVKQAAAMNLKISDNFKIPPASMASLSAFGTIISVPIYDRIIVPILRKVRGNERGISILGRIGIGLIFLVILMVVAALVENMRLRMPGHETMSVMWLIPQYLILGIGNSFYLIALQEYFYDEVPDSMRSVGMALYLSVIGIGFFLSSFLIIIVDHVTGKNGKGWIAKDVNSSRLDKFYWMLAVISALNLCLFLFLAKRFTYKTARRKATEIDCSNCDGVDTVA